MRKIILLLMIACSHFSLSAMDRFARDTEEIESILAPLNSLQLTAPLSDEEIATRIANLPAKLVPQEIVNAASFSENNTFTRGEIVLTSNVSARFWYYSVITHANYLRKIDSVTYNDPQKLDT